jgi:hypothetical protein
MNIIRKKWNDYCNKIWRTDTIAFGLILIFWKIPVMVLWRIPVFIVLLPFVALSRSIRWVKKIVLCSRNVHDWDVRQHKLKLKQPKPQPYTIALVYRTCRRCPRVECQNFDHTLWLSVQAEPKEESISLLD